MTPPDSKAVVVLRAVEFIQKMLPEADDIAKYAIAHDIADRLWPRILAWRSVKKKAPV